MAKKETPSDEQGEESSSLLQQQRPSNSLLHHHAANTHNSPSIIYASYGSPCNSYSSRGQRRRRQLSAAAASSSSSSNKSSSASIPPSLRWTTNAASLLSALLFTGIIFGWAPLKLILLREGQYQELCQYDDNGSSSNNGTDAETVIRGIDSNSSNRGNPAVTSSVACVQQLDRFNLIFTLAQFLLSFCSLPVGFFLDYASITVHYGFAAVFQVGGLILFGLSESSSNSTSSSSDDAIRPSWSWFWWWRTDDDAAAGESGGQDYFVLAYSCMALGGCMTMLGAFPASFLLPRHQPAILAAISCLFDASSIIFAIFNRLNEKYGTTTLFSRRHLFLTYAVVAIFIYSLLSYCWASIEKHDWKSIVETESQTATAKTSTNQKEQGSEANHHHEDHNGSAVEDGDGGDSSSGGGDSHLLQCRRRGMHEWSLIQQLQTFEFLLVLTFASVHMLRCNFYIETVNEILASMTTAARTGDNQQQHNDDDEAVLYANVFSFVLPVGIIFVPLIESTVRRFGIVQTLHLTNALGIVFGALVLVPSLYVQAANFLIFTCFRAYLYATLNTFIALTFGVSTMGRMIGCTFTTAAIVTLLQYPAAAMAQGRFHNDYTVVNIIMLSACALPTGLAFLYSSGSNGLSSHHRETSGKA